MPVGISDISDLGNARDFYPQGVISNSLQGIPQKYQSRACSRISQSGEEKRRFKQIEKYRSQRDE